jgi:hypothetical protein
MFTDSVLSAFLAEAKQASAAELQALQQGLNNLVRIKVNEFNGITPLSSGAPSQFDQAFTLPVLNVPAELLVNYHKFVFQTFISEMFNPYDPDAFYAPDPECLTNASNVHVQSSWGNTDEKIGQLPRVIIDCVNGGLSDLYLADTASPAETTLSKSVSNKNQQCLMTLNMGIQVIAGTPDETTNLANIIWVNLAKVRSIIRSMMDLVQITYPSFSAAQPLEDDPSHSFISSIQFQTKKMVNWHEQVLTIVKINKALTTNYLKLKEIENFAYKTQILTPQGVVEISSKQ